MKIITRQSLANTAANRWAVQYSSSMNQDRAQTLEDLRDLGPTPDPDSVDAIIGNSSWTTTRCDECGTKNIPVVELGDDPDYPDTSSTICVCLSCLNSAINMIESSEN